MTKAGKKYEVHGGVVMKTFIDEGRSFRYHGPSKYDEPTVTFYLIYNGSKLTQQIVSKAASRVLRCSAVLTQRQLQISTKAAIQSWAEATLLADTFVYELNKLLCERDRTVAAHSAAKSGARSSHYVNRP